MNREELLNLGFIDEQQYKAACDAVNDPNTKLFGLTGLRQDKEIASSSVFSARANTPSTSYYSASSAFPSSADLTPQMPPVYNQGLRGTCVAQAGTALMEFYFGGKYRLSQQFLYWVMKREDNSNFGEKKLREWLSTSPCLEYEPFKRYLQDFAEENAIKDTIDADNLNLAIESFRECFSGSTFNNLEHALREFGICDYNLMPYSPNQVFESEAQSPTLDNDELLARSMREPLQNALSRRMGDKLRVVVGNSIDTYKKYISGADGTRPMPVVICMNLYKSLGSTYANRTGWFSGHPANDQCTGRHAMLAVGYCDAPLVPGGGYLIVRNSWGTNWAWDWKYAGYARIPYAIVESDADSCALTISETQTNSSDEDDESIWFAAKADPIERYIKVAERDMRNRFGKFAIAKGKKIIVDPDTGKADIDTPNNRAEFAENGYSWEV